MQTSTIIQFTAEDFDQKLRELKLKEEESILDRYYTKLVSTSTVAEIHDISTRTVCRYVERGLLPVVERNSSKGNYKFRLSEVLKLDFNKLRKLI